MVKHMMDHDAPCRRPSRPAVWEDTHSSRRCFVWPLNQSSTSCLFCCSHFMFAAVLSRACSTASAAGPNPAAPCFSTNSSSCGGTTRSTAQIAAFNHRETLTSLYCTCCSSAGVENLAVTPAMSEAKEMEPTPYLEDAQRARSFCISA